MLKLKTGYHMKQRMKSGIKIILDQKNKILPPRNRNYKIKQFRAHKFSNSKVDQKRHFQMSRNIER